ncbi:MAG: MFS transporter [Acidobacteria bacterium]|nr:MAG: MFS transporter [Acidobacteriota bacterium]
MSDPPLPVAAETPNAALHFRDFRLYQAARLASVLSSEMIAVAVGWQVYEITHRALSLGYVGLAQVLPSFVLFLISGHAVDRFDRRAVILWVQAGYALVAGALLWISLAHWHAVGAIYAVMVFQGVVRAFGGPAGQALMPELVPAEHFANAVTWGSTVFMMATIVGPGLGGLVYGWTRGAASVYALATAAYVISMALMFAIATRTGRMEKKAATLDTLLAGFRYVKQNQVILGTISLDLFAVLLGGAVALLPIYASDILHTGVRGLGLLRAAPSLGAMVMAIMLAFHPLSKRAGKRMLLAVALFGLTIVGFGLSRNLALSLALLFVMGAADMVSVVVRQTVVQLQTPSHMRGRVSAINSLFIGTSNQLGEFESGLTAQWWGAVPATIVGGLGTLAVVAGWWRAFPALRNVDSLRERPPAALEKASQQR